MRRKTNAEKRFGSPLPRLAGGDDKLDPTELEGTLLEKLQAKRSAISAEIEPLINAREEEHEKFEARLEAEDETQRPSEEERNAFNTSEREFREQVNPKLKEIKALDLRIDQQETVERSKEIAARASQGGSGSIRILSEPDIYRSDDKDSPSYFIDLAAHLNPNIRAKLGSKADGFSERLERHGKMIQDVLPKRMADRDRRAERQIEEAERHTRMAVSPRELREFETSPFERRAPSRIEGQGGWFVPPIYLIDEYIPFLRPGRVAAGLCRNMELPTGTDSINVPALTTPTRVGIQAADNAPIVSQDIKDGIVTANVKTIAGFSDIPVQLIEQSPGQIIDRVIWVDMLADYDEKLDLQVVAGNGSGAPLSGGQIKGIYPSTNWGATALTWNAGSPTGQGYFQLLGAMASKVAQSRFNLQDFTFLGHPRRWFWAATALDSNNRQLVENQDFGPYNASALEVGDQTPFEGLVGRVPFGPRYYIDANVPSNDAGHETAGVANGDVSIGAIWDDLWLFEGDVKTDVFTETLSGIMQIRFRLYNYVTMLQRYGPSVAIATGTGSAPPVTIDGVAY